MATEILLNDGGAPARVMNLGLANAAIEAGMFVEINSSGLIIADSDDQEASSSGQKTSLGVLLVDAASSGPTSIITGKGVVCNVQAAEAITCGHELTVDDEGKVEPTVDADAHRVVGKALAASFNGTDSGGNTTVFVKALII